jgi:hypothetical protein
LSAPQQKVALDVEHAQSFFSEDLHPGGSTFTKPLINAMSHDAKYSTATDIANVIEKSENTVIPPKIMSEEWLKLRKDLEQQPKSLESLPVISSSGVRMVRPFLDSTFPRINSLLTMELLTFEKKKISPLSHFFAIVMLSIISTYGFVVVANWVPSRDGSVNFCDVVQVQIIFLPS